MRKTAEGLHLAVLP